MKKDIVGNNNTVLIGSGSLIRETEFCIRGNNNRIVIGENCGYHGGSIWIEGNGGVVEIGDRTSVVSAHLCVQEHGNGIRIGADCMFSNNITVRTSDSHPIYDRNGVRLNPAASVGIGDHVWICAKATVMKGVRIGDRSVVGYQSVVTSDIPDCALAVGSPARIVKNGVEWSREALF